MASTKQQTIDDLERKNAVLSTDRERLAEELATCMLARGKLAQAARAVVDDAEADTDDDGEYVDCLVAADVLAALRAVVEAEP